MSDSPHLQSLMISYRCALSEMADAKFHIVHSVSFVVAQFVPHWPARAAETIKLS
jgi:hypothetical protein